MNVVKDLQNLIQLMHSREEVIIFPIGAEGQQLLDFLRYSNFLHRVCCIAATQVDGGVSQRFIHELPIIPFENLVHFRETALLVVATPEQFQANIDAELKQFGFKFVVFIRNETQEQINDELQKMYTSGQVIMWYINYFDRKIANLEYRIAEQNEISTVNTKAFDTYRNAFSEKKIVIVASGPTLKYYNPLHDAIHIGLNYAWEREDIPLDYLFIQDSKAHSKGRSMYPGFSRVHGRVFIGKFIGGVDYDWRHFSENASILAKNAYRFYSNVHSVDQLIYPDITHKPVMDFCSIAFPALHFSLFTYPKQIYLVGCDTSTSGHFYDQLEIKKGLDKHEIYIGGLKVGYARMKMFAKQYYPDTEIISINPVGLRGLFKDVYTEEYKAELEENKK